MKSRLILTVFLLSVGLLGCKPSEHGKANLRAIGDIERLPIAPSRETAQQFMFDYSAWGSARHVTGAENSKRVSFRAEVELLETGPEISKVKAKLAGGEDAIGWIPSDWLENYAGSVKERENPVTKSIRQEAKRFLGLTETQLRVKLGPPIKTERGKDAIEGGVITLVYDETPSAERACNVASVNSILNPLSGAQASVASRAELRGLRRRPGW